MKKLWGPLFIPLFSQEPYAVVTAQGVPSPHLHTRPPESKMFLLRDIFCEYPVSHRKPSSAMLGLRSHLWSPKALHLDKSLKISRLIAHNRGLPKHLVKGEEMLFLRDGNWVFMDGFLFWLLSPCGGTDPEVKKGMAIGPWLSCC